MPLPHPDREDGRAGRQNHLAQVVQDLLLLVARALESHVGLEVPGLGQRFQLGWARQRRTAHPSPVVQANLSTKPNRPMDLGYATPDRPVGLLVPRTAKEE